MAIKINGTTVIDDSRNLVNIASGAGSSTAFNDVGTYVWGARQTNNISQGSTYAGSTIYPAGTIRFSNDGTDGYGAFYVTRAGTTLSGTWRAMGRMQVSAAGSTDMSTTLFVRIS